MTEERIEETLLTFPCPFDLKVMGKNTPEFEAAVVAIVRRHVSDLGEGAVRSRPSKGDRWLALTLSFTAHSRVQLDDLYRELNACEHVAMTL